MEKIRQYFPKLSQQQYDQLAMLGDLYREWNAKINVVSRKDIDNIYEHHVLHSMAIARFITFCPGTRILDFGTGGGFPGIPLAILFPECSFKLIDGTGKKITVAKAVADAIGLKNCTPVQLRGEDEKEKFDFVVSRAVMPLPDLAKIVRKNIDKQKASSKPKGVQPSTGPKSNVLPNGIICLKGGNIESEIAPFRKIAETADISYWFHEEWFQEKHVVYVPL